MQPEKRTAQRLLIVDDEQGIRQLLDATFRERGYDVATAPNGDRAIELLAKQAFDIVITDLKMPGRDGLAVLSAAKEISVDTQVLVITAYGTVETAVEAMRRGARDFIAKPFKLAEIELKVDKILREREDREAYETGSDRSFARRIIGESEHTRNLLDMVRKVAQSKSSVLVTGPSGVGKELVARAIHDASPRRDKPYVALNCAALAPGVLESELFGHEKGSFTGASARRIGRFERAHRGTLFLDEVGEIDPNIQTKLLRVLQENEFERVGGTETLQVDVRIVAATNTDLRQAIDEGRFREDFFYRLNVFSLQVKPLRKRPDDIPGLVDLFLRKFSNEAGKRIDHVEDDVMDFFMHYAWPGNVRELENVIERAVVLADAGSVTMEEIPPEMLAGARPPSGPEKPGEPTEEPAPSPPPALPEATSLAEQTDALESELIYQALQRFRWNKTKAADHLGLKRTTLQYKIRKYGLE